MRETLADFQVGEDYINEKEAHRDDALKEFYLNVEKRTMKIEHLVPKDREGEEVYNKSQRVAKVIDRILDLGNEFTYKTEIYGRFGHYDEEFTYNFSTYAEDHLADTLGYYKEEN